MGFGDFNEEPKLPILFDLETWYVKSFSLSGFESLQPVCAFTRLLPQIIQLLVYTGMENSTLKNWHRLLGNDPCGDVVH